KSHRMSEEAEDVAEKNFLGGDSLTLFGTIPSVAIAAGVHKVGTQVGQHTDHLGVLAVVNFLQCDDQLPDLVGAIIPFRHRIEKRDDPVERRLIACIAKLVSQLT